VREHLVAGIKDVERIAESGPAAVLVRQIYDLAGATPEALAHTPLGHGAPSGETPVRLGG
jgi:hypothetical protein